VPFYFERVYLKVFVTGATGFVGSHVAKELASRGAELRLLIRATSRTENIDSLKAERVVGDLCDAASLKEAIAGCEYVFHVAADYRLWTPDSKAQDMYKANVEGTRTILQVAREVGVRRVIYCSSVATMGFNGSARPVREDDPVALADMIGHYKKSKFIAEQVALHAARSSAEDGAKGLQIVVVNPTTPVGEQDIKPTPTGRIVVDFLNRKFPAYVDTGLNLVDVTEVAKGHILAMEKGIPGQRYILGGEDLTLKQLLDKLAAITGLPSPTMKVPHAVALGFAVFDELITGKVRGREPRATIDAVRMGRKKMFASSAKAERELGYEVVPVEGALRRAVEWFNRHGYITPALTSDLHPTKPTAKQPAQL
jgi:dihydroflavonol-4-reductase